MAIARHAAQLALPLLTLFALGASAAEQPFRQDLGPGKVGEVCMPLAMGDTLSWHFKASHALDFNLHHHVGTQVLMPIDRKQVTADHGQHRIDQRNDWCLMWTAGAAGATIEGAWSAQAAAAAASTAGARPAP